MRGSGENKPVGCILSHPKACRGTSKPHIYILIHSFIHSPIHSFTHSFTYQSFIAATLNQTHLTKVGRGPQGDSEPNVGDSSMRRRAGKASWRRGQ